MVYRDPVRLLQVLFARVEVIRDGLLPVLPLDERRDVLERSWAVQGIHRDEVAEDRGLQILEVLLHPRGFVLEDADGLAALKELVGLRVVEREAVRIEVNAVAVLDVAHRVLDDGQGMSKDILDSCLSLGWGFNSCTPKEWKWWFNKANYKGDFSFIYFK